MPWWSNQLFHSSFALDRFFLFPLLAPVVIWSLIWKGLTLWRAAQNKQKAWFVVLLVVNTAGILEIMYLLFFSNPEKDKKKKSLKNKR